MGTAENASHLICSRSMPVERWNRKTSDQLALPITGIIVKMPIEPSGSTSAEGSGVNGLSA